MQSFAFFRFQLNFPSHWKSMNMNFLSILQFGQIFSSSLPLSPFHCFTRAHAYSQMTAYLHNHWAIPPPAYKDLYNRIWTICGGYSRYTKHCLHCLAMLNHNIRQIAVVFCFSHKRDYTKVILEDGRVCEKNLITLCTFPSTFFDALTVEL